jgi:hypothetical protein
LVLSLLPVPLLSLLPVLLLSGVQERRVGKQSWRAVR